MNSDNNNPGDGAFRREHNEQLDLLISRIADGEAGRADWDAFGALAERSPGAWRALAQAQRDHASLSLAVGVALHAADRVDLPSRAGAVEFHRRVPERISPFARMGSWSGWAAAAVIGLAWLSGRSGVGMNTPPGNAAGLLPVSYTINNPEDAVKAYLDVGQKQNLVVGELPQRVVVESRPVQKGGGIEVLYVRQFVERAVVNDLVKFGADELNRPVPVRVPMPQPAAQPD